MYSLYEIQRNDTFISNFQFMKIKSKDLYNFPNFKDYIVQNYWMFYPRRNFIVGNDDNINHTKLHDLSFNGTKNKIVVYFEYTNIDIDFESGNLYLYERYSKDSMFNESISIDEFLKYPSHIIRKVLYRFYMKKYAELGYKNKNWIFSIYHINDDVISDIKYIIKREFTKYDDKS